MIQADIADYPSVRPIFAGLQYNLAIDSVLGGSTPGRAFADRLPQPEVGLLWDGQAALFLAGEPGDDLGPQALLDLVRGVIVPEARRRGVETLALHYYPLAWEPLIRTVWASLAPVRAARRFYRFDRPKVSWRSELPAGFEIQRLDRSLFNRKDLAHLSLAARQVRSYWPSLEAFEEAGIGYCLLDEMAVHSWCFSRYGYGDELELYAETAPELQGQGDASLAAAACLDFCTASGRIPHWHCWEEDRACLALASRVGFSQPARYPVFRIATSLP